MACSATRARSVGGGASGRADRATPNSCRATRAQLREAGGDARARLAKGVGVQAIAAPHQRIGRERIVRDVEQARARRGRDAANLDVERVRARRQRARERRRRARRRAISGIVNRQHDAAPLDERALHVAEIVGDRARIEPRPQQVVHAGDDGREIGRERERGGQLAILDLARAVTAHAEVGVRERAVLRGRDQSRPSDSPSRR